MAPVFAYIYSDILLIPAFLHRILASLNFRKREWHVRGANLSWPTDTNIRITIRSHTDWIAFNEVFANGEYDYSIERLLSNSTNGHKTVLDLGANVGFFTLRLAHAAISKGYQGNLFIKSIEAAPTIYGTLRENINQQNIGRNIQIEPYHGLVGLRQGSGMLYLFARHVLNSMLKKTSKVAQVAFINLSEVTSDWESIDLIKCDIEGSELTFIKNYPDVLQKTKAAIFEFHHEMCSREECIQLLKESGFEHREIVKRHAQSSVEYFYR